MGSFSPKIQNIGRDVKDSKHLGTRAHLYDGVYALLRHLSKKGDLGVPIQRVDEHVHVAHAVESAELGVFERLDRFMHVCSCCLEKT
jgi:hypothetical protein